jgi:hypothetical protein
MNLKLFLYSRQLMHDKAERQTAWRMKKAIRKSLEPLFEAVENRTLVSPEQAYTLVKPQHIEEVMRWLYVDWGFRMLTWFKRNYDPRGVKSFDWRQRLEEWFKTNGAEKVKLIYATTIEKTKELINIALPLANSGASVDKIQAAIKEKIQSGGGVISDGRARTIARTEVIGASENASYQAMAGENVNVEKKWVTGGSNIRPSHSAAEAEGWKPFDYVYTLANSNGVDRMKHPHDNGSAENVINCKCTLIYRVVD